MATNVDNDRDMREAVIRAWEAANLPPDLAELRRKQREAARQAKEAEEQ